MAARKMIIKFNDALKLRECCLGLIEYISMIILWHESTGICCKAGMELEQDYNLLENFVEIHYTKDNILNVEIPSFAFEQLSNHLDRIIKNYQEIINMLCCFSKSVSEEYKDIMDMQLAAKTISDSKMDVRKQISKIKTIAKKYIKEKN